MIQKILFIASLCLFFNACEMHPPSQMAEAHEKQMEKEKQVQKGEQPQGGNADTPQILPQKKNN